MAFQSPVPLPGPTRLSLAGAKLGWVSAWFPFGNSCPALSSRWAGQVPPYFRRAVSLLASRLGVGFIGLGYWPGFSAWVFGLGFRLGFSAWVLSLGSWPGFLVWVPSLGSWLGFLAWVPGVDSWCSSGLVFFPGFFGRLLPADWWGGFALSKLRGCESTAPVCTEALASLRSTSSR